MIGRWLGGGWTKPLDGGCGVSSRGRIEGLGISSPFYGWLKAVPGFSKVEDEDLREFPKGTHQFRVRVAEDQADQVVLDGRSGGSGLGQIQKAGLDAVEAPQGHGSGFRG